MAHFKLWLTTPDGSRCVINETDSRVLGQLEEKRENVRIKYRIVLRLEIFNEDFLGQ